jgi:hypothetical protein
MIRLLPAHREPRRCSPGNDSVKYGITREMQDAVGLSEPETCYCRRARRGKV